MDKNAKIYVAGHTGLVGSAIVSNLNRKGYNNLVFRTMSELDLRNQLATENFFKSERPEYVILAAAKVGGIMANNVYRADFIYENILIQSNVIHSAYLTGVKKLLFLGSSCIYPKNCPQPIKEEYLLTDTLEYTNEPYAIAKIAGIKMCESYNIQYGTNFISVMPTNLYGPNDNYDLEKSHVLPAIIRKMHLAKCLLENNWETIRIDIKKTPVAGLSEKSSDSEIITVLNKYGITRTGKSVNLNLWGSGTPLREFMYSEDMSDACIYLLENIDFSDISKPDNSNEIRNTHVNIGTGTDCTIAELADIVKEVVGFRGTISWDKSKPDGTYRKLLNVDKLHSYGWRHSIELKQGVEMVYKKYVSILHNLLVS